MSIDSNVDTLEIRNADKIKFIGTSNTIIDTTTGRVGIGMEPTNALDVMGNVYVSSNLQVSNINFTGSFNQNGASFSSSPWTVTGDDLSYTTGKVGVGTNSPSGTLHIAPSTSTGHTITASPTSQWGILLEPEVYNSGFSSYYNNGDITGVANDSSGNVYVIGSYRSDNAYDLGNGVSLPAATLPAVSTAGYLIKYNSSGTPHWANTFIPANAQFTSGESVATDSNGNVYVTGRFVSSVNFGNSITLTGSGQTDAFIVKFNGSGVAQWAKKMSGSSVSYPYGIATDSSGNVYTVGYYNSTTSIDLGNSVTLSASTASDAFLVKHNTDGVAQWVINIDTSGTCQLKAVTTDSGGNVFVTGQYSSNSDVSLAPYVTLPNSSNVTHGFIVKYTSGTAQWVKVINGTTTCAGRNVATDSNGNIYLVGQHSSTSSIDLGNSVSLPVTVSSDAFVVKYNTGGTPQWAKSISGTGNDSSYGIATNSNGDVYVVGDYTSTSDIDIGNNLTLSANSTANTQEGFIIIYDTDGTPQSVRIVSGSSARVQLRQIKVDSNNNIYVGGAGLLGTNQITIDDNTTLTRSTNASSMMQDVTGLLIKYVTQGTLTDTALTVAGNTEIGTANLFVNTTSGKVGVGTKTPSAKLHIVPDDVTTTDLSSITSQWGSLLETQWFDTSFYSTVSSNQVDDVAVDSNGNVYVTGHYRSQSTWDVGNGVTLPAQGGSKQSFTIKYNSTGTPQWGKTIGGNLGEGKGIVTDSSGNVYVTGFFNSSGTVDLGNSVTLPNMGTSLSFTYIVKYDTDGTAQWANAVPATNGSGGYGIAVDSSGNVYVTGWYRETTGTTSLGNGVSLPTTNTQRDPCTIKYNSTGLVEWANGIGTEGGSGAGPNIGYGIATDSDGNVYVTGTYYHSGPSAISLGNGVTIPVNSSTSDAFIVKYNTGGTAQWANVIDSRQTIGYGIATDSSGNVYVTGIYEYYGSSISLGNSVTLPDANTAGKNIFTAKYDTNGVAQWANALETSPNNSYGYGIATDSNGNVYVTGIYSLNSSIDLGNNFTLPVKSSRGYVVIYDTDGTTQGVRVIDATSGSCNGRGIATGSNDTIFVCGNIPSLGTGGSVTIDDTTTLTRTTTFTATPEDNIGLIIKYSTQTSILDTALTAAGVLNVTDNTAATTTTTGALTVAGGVGVGGAIHSGGAISAANDQNVTSYFGRAAVGYDGTTSDAATFAHIDNNSDTSFSLKQLANGETQINSKELQSIKFLCNNVEKANFTYNGNFVVDVDTFVVREDTDRVGINCNPSYDLDVAGDINFTGSLYQNGVTYGGSSGSTSYWGLSGSNISYTSGDVGIGTSSPQGNLHISSGTAGDCRLILEADTDNNNEGDNPRIEFWQDGSVQASAIGMTNHRLNLWNSISDVGAGIAFHTNSTDGYTNAVERMTITSTGFVGIGTSSPQGNLHISSGTSGDCRLILQADTDNNNEGDNPRIEFWQDGSIQESAIGMTSNRLNLWNSVSSAAGIAFHTGTVDGYTNAIERMTITSTGSVGINQTSPGYTLDVGGNINFTGNLTQNGVTYGGSSGGSSQWTTVNTNEIYYNAGNVGIGLTNPNYTLHVGGDIYATGNVTAYSDKRAKTNLQIIDDALDKVSNLNGYTYEKDGTKYTGLVAQEVLEILPEAVVGNEEDGYGLAYGNMVGILVEAIKELSNEVKILKEKLSV